MASRYALNQIAAKYERVHYAGKNPSRCGCVMKTTRSLPCVCELSKYVLGTIPLETIHMFWRRLSFFKPRVSDPQVTIIEDMETISKRFEELDVCGKVTLKRKLQEISYPDLNSMCAPPKKVKTKGAQKKPMTKHQRLISMIYLSESMMMHYILCKIVILQSNIVHHHLTKQN